MKLIKILYILAVPCMLACCTVLEDRKHCPCHVVLDFSSTDTTLIPSVDIRISDGNDMFLSESVEAGIYMPEYAVSIPRSRLYLNIYSGDGLQLDDRGGLTVPSGSECPKVYMHSAFVDATSEELRHVVEMHKNHCVMKIVMENEGAARYELRVRGNVCGYGMDGSPAEGEFDFVPHVSGSGHYEVVLPRQKDSSLMLEIDDGSEVLKKFSLGEFIAAGGYDWAMPDLEDMTVYIDWTMTTISLEVQGWDWKYEHEIVI